MQLNILKTHYGRASTDVHGVYEYLFWDVKLTHNYTLTEELNRKDIWHDSEGFGSCQRYNLIPKKSQLLDNFCQEFEKFKDQLLDLVTQYKCFKYRWFRDIEYYRNKTSARVIINKDTEGMFMRPHVDNNHIMVQTIINLVDNTSGTELYEFNNSTPIYQMPADVNKGVAFFNNPGAVHGIRNITRDRYTLYAALVYE